MGTTMLPGVQKFETRTKASRTIGISDLHVERGNGIVLVTYSLGSCVGISIFDPVAHVGAMIHCMLPLSKIDAVKAQATPAMFVDTGVPLMLQRAFDLGAERSRMLVKVAGAGSPLDDGGVFNIGGRNYAVLRKILWKNDLLISAEDTGGNAARTMYLDMDTGETLIRSNGQCRVL